MVTKVQSSRSNVTGGRPAAGSRAVGEIYTNWADKQIGVIEPDGEPLDLIPITFFSASADYERGDMVRSGPYLLRALGEVTAGPFNPYEWERIDGDPIHVGHIPPPALVDGLLWVDTHGEAPVLKYWDRSKAVWVVVSVTNPFPEDAAGVMVNDGKGLIAWLPFTDASTGPDDAGKLVALDATGLIDASMLPAFPASVDASTGVDDAGKLAALDAAGLIDDSMLPPKVSRAGDTMTGDLSFSLGPDGAPDKSIHNVKIDVGTY